MKNNYLFFTYYRSEIIGRKNFKSQMERRDSSYLFFIVVKV